MLSDTYRVISEIGIEELEKRVNQLIERGYRVHGNLQAIPCRNYFKDTLYIQAMTKEIPTLDDQIIE